MPKTDPVEEAFHRLDSIKADPKSDAAMKELRTCMASKFNLVAAKAAKIAGEFQITGLAPDLAAAFERLMANPHKLDKGCLALTGIVGALQAMDYWGHDVFLKGLRHVQIEPAYPTPVDAAAELRARCALGLVQSGYRDACIELVSLLVDPEDIARIGAVRAIAAAAGDTAQLLLRLKVVTGDRSAEVLGECFSALLAIAPEPSIPFVATYVDAQNPSVCEEAMLALGESRKPAAFEILKRKWEGELSRPLKKTLLLAVATLRLDTAIDFLLSLLDSENLETASQIVTALAIYKNDARVRHLIENALNRRSQDSLAEHFRHEFGI